MVEEISSTVSEDSISQKQCCRKMYWAAFAVLLYAVVMGMACGYSASATIDMKRKNSPVRPSEEETSWIGSLIALGAFCGGLITGYLSNKFGRKGCLLLSTIVFLSGWLFITYADHIVYVYIGRFITGICVGIICVTTPAYLVEISTTKDRGLLGASFQLFVVIGVLVINGCGAILTWRWLTVPALALLVFAMCAVYTIPESPRWLIIKGQYSDAVAAVQFLQGNYLDASSECVAIDEDVRMQPKGSVSIKELCKKENLIPALLSFSLVFFQQASGSNSVLFYTVHIFQTSGSSIDPNIATIIVDAVLVLATAVSAGLMDKMGRKTLLIISGIGMGSPDTEKESHHMRC